MNGSGYAGKAQEEDEIGPEEYPPDRAPRGDQPHEPHAGAHGDAPDASRAVGRRIPPARRSLLSATFSELDKAIRKRTLAENTANRYKSRLALALNAIQGQEVAADKLTTSFGEALPRFRGAFFYFALSLEAMRKLSCGYGAS